MKIKTLVGVIALVTLLGGLLQAAPLGTPFTYQGQLADGGNPASGNYDLQFTLYDAASGGTAVAGPLIGSPVSVSNGLFTVTLDFGNSFDGNARWLEIAVRPHGSLNDFVTLWPRQLLTPSPYALYAPSAGAAATAASVPLSALPAIVPRLDTDLRMNVVGDLSVVAPPGPLLTEGFEGATFPPAGWVSGGNAPWLRTTNAFSEGEVSAVSGDIGNDQTSYLEFVCNVPGAALLKFDWRVDSERDFDFLRVSVDGVPISRITGSVNWTPMEVPLTAGTHTIRWYYTKDGSISLGQDCGWVDNVRVLMSASGFLIAEGLRVSGNAYFSNRVGIGTLNPARPLQIGDSSLLGSEALIRLASRSTNSGELRVWDIGVPQTGTNVAGAGYSFVIDDTLFGTGPEFVVHWGNGRVGIGRTNPVSALDVSGTVTATDFAGNASGLTNLSAAQITGTLSTNHIAPGTIAGAMLVNGAVGASQLAADAVTGAKIADGTITLTDLGANSVDSARIVDGSVVLADLAANSVDGSKVVDGSLTSGDLASDAGSLAKVSGGAMAITSGRVAIGAGSSDRPLAITGSGPAGEWLSLRDTSGVTKWHLNNSSGGLDFVETGVADARLFIKPGGNIGIGTVNPGFKLSFPNEHGNKISLWGSSGAHYGFGIQSSRLQIHTDTSGSDIVFGYGESTNFTENVRFKGNGNVGIGTATPSARLTIDGAGSSYALATSHPQFVLDQASEAASGSIAGAGSYWQSFTAGSPSGGTSNLVAVSIDFGASDGLSAWTATLRIYEGEGTGGAMLSQQGIGGLGGRSWKTCVLPAPIPITPGSNYTIYVYIGISGSWTISGSDVYPGGRSEWNAGRDYRFRTYQSTTGANQPSFVVTSGDGYVGVGTANPARPLQVGDASLAGAEGFIRLSSRSETNSSYRSWDIGVPQTGGDTTGIGYSFVIDDIGLGSTPEFMIKWGTGNIGIGNTNPTNKLMVVNARCDGSSWINASDRNLKQGFQPVNPQAMLDKLMAMPVQTWSYKAQPEQQHIGPVAQDFHAAFGLGSDDRSIATVDESGVALAAIQGLNQKLVAELYRRDVETAELKRTVQQLQEALTKLLNQQKNASKF